MAIKPTPLSDELTREYGIGIPYMKAKALESAGAFLLLGASTRHAPEQGRFKAHDEAVFTVMLVEGERAGETYQLTLGMNAPRANLSRLIKDKGPIGPVHLVAGEKPKDGTSPPWQFENARDVSLPPNLVERPGNCPAQREPRESRPGVIRPGPSTLPDHLQPGPELLRQRAIHHGVALEPGAFVGVHHPSQLGR